MLQAVALGAWSCAPAPWSHGFPSGKFPDPLFTPLASHACDASRATHQNLWTPEVLYGYRIGCVLGRVGTRTHSVHDVSDPHDTRPGCLELRSGPLVAISGKCLFSTFGVSQAIMSRDVFILGGKCRKCRDTCPKYQNQMSENNPEKGQDRTRWRVPAGPGSIYNASTD